MDTKIDFSYLNKQNIQKTEASAMPRLYLIEDYKNALRFITAEGDLRVYSFTPSLFRLLAVPLEQLYIARKFRFIFELIQGGYSVYYLTKKDIIVGYCVVTPGGRRLKCSTKEDGVIGPLYICPEYRGKGLSKFLISKSMICCSTTYTSFYCWVYKDNLPSRRSFEACGFIPINKLDVLGFFRRLVINPKGDNIVYKKV